MFGFLKNKLKEWVDTAKEKLKPVEAEEKPEEIDISKEPKKIKKPKKEKKLKKSKKEAIKEPKSKEKLVSEPILLQKEEKLATEEDKIKAEEEHEKVQEIVEELEEGEITIKEAVKEIQEISQQAEETIIKSSDSEEEPAQKKSFFKRLFGKKKEIEKKAIEEIQVPSELAPPSDSKESELASSSDSKESELASSSDSKESEPAQKSFFQKVKSSLAYKITEDDFNSLFESLEMLLLENNVALESVEDIKSKLSKKLIGKEISKGDLEDEIKKELKNSIEEILIDPEDPIELVKIKKSEKDQPFVILFFGVNGTGKCLAGDTKIQLSNGEIEEIKNIYENYSQRLQKQISEDGEIIELKEDLLIPSFNPKTLKIEDKKITHLWKLKKEDLYEIKLDNGNDFSIKVTPEHPFFILREGRVIKVRADELTGEDYIAIPNQIKIDGKLQALSEDIKKFDLDIYLTPEEIKEYVCLENKSLIEIHKNLKSKRNYCYLSMDIKKGKIPIELLNKEYPNVLKIKEKMSKRVITFPTNLTIELAEFLGYLMGDGNLRPNYIQISNEDPEVINRIKDLSKIIFNIEPAIKKAKRTKNMYDIRICSKTLVNLMSIFGLKAGKKGKHLRIPKQITLSDNETIRKFIKAYFDCDGSPAKKNRNIELTSESELLVKQMDMLLKRLGIITAISKRTINNVFYWRLSINSKYAEKYAEKIGSIIKNKKERLEKYSLTGLRQGCGKQDMIPLGKSLKKLRLLLGFAIADIQKHVPGYQIYEKKGIISKDRLKLLVEYYKLKNRGSFFKLLESLNKGETGKFPAYFINGMLTQLKKENLIQTEEYERNKIQLTKDGKQYLQLMNKSSEISNLMLKEFECIANSDVCWISLASAEKIKNNDKVVYDLTVKDNHSFIAEGFIVHNTTSIAKIAHLLKEKNFSVVLAAADTFRAASIEQIAIHAEKLKIHLIKQDYGADPSAVGFDAIKYAQNHKIDVVLIDTAGRMHTKTNLISEMEKICRVTKPDLKLFVAESIAGNDATEQARTFNEAIRIDGSILSKADVDEKGGTIISVSHVTKKPIIYLGTGQKYNDLKLFNKEDFIKSLGL